MNKPTEIDGVVNIVPLIRSIRDARVILDRDLARLYGVETRALNQAVKRNQNRFPQDFVLVLAREEILRISQSVTSLRKLRFSRQVRAFTEHGALMAANVLNSPRAVDMSVFVVRAFVKMRSAFGDTRQLARKLALLERELTSRLDTHEAAIVDVLQRITRLLDPPPPPPEPPPPEIGFHVKEDAVAYRINRKTPRSA